MVKGKVLRILIIPKPVLATRKIVKL